MTYGIAVQSKDKAEGIQLGGGQTFFIVEKLPVIVVGDPVQGHGPVVHAAPVMAEGSSWMTLNGIPACRLGHKASCGHPTTGRSWFRIT